jgi:hypothetical protein
MSNKTKPSISTAAAAGAAATAAAAAAAAKAAKTAKAAKPSQSTDPSDASAATPSTAHETAPQPAASTLITPKAGISNAYSRTTDDKISNTQSILRVALICGQSYSPQVQSTSDQSPPRQPKSQVPHL